VKPDDPVTNAMFIFNTKRKFKEITMDTQLLELERFFEESSSAVVTSRESDLGIPVVKKVVTKVDLLVYLMKK